MKPRAAAGWLAVIIGLGLIGLSGACGGGGAVTQGTADEPWVGATALTAREDHPFGVVVDGSDVLYTTGLTQVGDHAVRIAPLDPALPVRRGSSSPIRQGWSPTGR